MRILDRLLQDWRARVARRWIPTGSQVLDIGCHQGEFLQSLGEHIGPSVGIDPLALPREGLRFEFVAEAVRESIPPLPIRGFDTIVMLATLEHIRDKVLARECHRLLRPGGRVIITVPSPFVDELVELLRRLRAGGRHVVG